MTARTTRILKEARPLFWPWCVVAMAGALPLVHPPESIGWISAIGFFLGIPLLATLSLGNEFQHRTLSLLLSQPIGRMEIWAEKMGVTILAVLSAGLLYYFCLLAPLLPGLRIMALPALWVVATPASATFWTLFARSTLGGVVLNVAGIFSVILARFLAGMLVHRNYHVGWISSRESSVYLVLLCYAGATLWLGRRKLARFEVTGGLAGDDLLTAGPDVLPAALAGWLRCRASGAVPNLIRKELRLLRPVWLITLLAAVGWTCLALFRLLHPQVSRANFEFAVVSVGVISTLMIAILAGSLSLGEERTSGTHAWHLTMPVSALRLWSVKLFMALFAGVLGAGLLPDLFAARWLGRAGIFIDVRPGPAWLAAALLLTFASFWCACAVNGTVRAVLWVIPVTMVLGWAGIFARQLAVSLAIACWGPNGYQFFPSSWLIASLANHRPLMLNLLGNLRFDWWVTRVTGPHFHLWSLFPIEDPKFYASVVAVPAVLLAFVQSYRLFRAPAQDSARPVLRNLLPLALLVFLCGFSLTLFSDFWFRAAMQVTYFTATIGGTIQTTLPEAAKLHPTQPLELTGDDVTKALRRWTPNEVTRRWLSGARITVAPDKAHPGRFFCTPSPWGKTWCYYSATIHLADGTDIFLSHDSQGDWKFFFGFSSVRVRWPGATRDEPLYDR